MAASPPETGYLRLPQIVGKPATESAPAIPAIIPVSKSTWWAGVRSGRYPQPTRALGDRITAWRVEDIRALIERAA
jgi:predicted DNA-binding transcriptional regulator AlpA